MNKLYSILWDIGKLSGCHQLSERSFFYRGRQFPLCARCTGTFIGYYFGLLTYRFMSPTILLCTILCMIMFLDWLLQYMNIFPSNNIRRVITGVICGYGIIHIFIKTILHCINYIRYLEGNLM